MLSRFTRGILLIVSVRMVSRSVEEEERGGGVAYDGLTSFLLLCEFAPAGSSWLCF